MGELTIRPLRSDETRRFAELSYYAFSGRTPDEREADFGRRVVPERQVLVGAEDGEIVSQVLMYDFGIWIDGVRYRSGGLANVATAPEKSRRGYASRVLRSSLAWMHDELGMTLSTLYPTMYPLYRGLGWAIGQESHRYSGAPAAFRPSSHMPADPGGRIVRRLATLDDVGLLEPIYRRFAEPRTAYLDRPRWYWQDTVLRYQHATQPRWLALWYGSDQQLAGYVLYSLVSAPPGAQQESQLNVWELVAIRPEGYHALLTFLSSHHLWSKVTLRGGRDVAWSSLVANPHHLDVQAPPGSNFMLRIINVPKAISERKARVANVPDLILEVRDEAAPWNHGNWLIGQHDGRWICERTSKSAPDASLDVSTLAALFVGAVRVQQALDSGALRAEEHAQPALQALFALPYPPHSGDYF